MAIDLFGHTSYGMAEANRRLDYARRAHPEWFIGPLHLPEASGLGPFGADIAREFGIEAKCLYGLYVHDKERLEVLGPAVEFLYQVFGTDHLVITYGMDSVRSPEGRYPPMVLQP
jgi:hypothetical protein